MTSRKFSVREINHMRHFGFSTEDLSIYGEKPVEYITGHAEFYHLDFLVTPAVLIPRIETEKIVDLGYSFLKSVKNKPLQIADLGSGSGCLGISLAKKLLETSTSDFHLYFSDLSEEALGIARGNSLRLLPGHQDKLHFLVSDLLERFPSDLKLDLLFANLPYIPSARLKTLDSSVKDYEPHLALDGGPEGTSQINRLLTQITNFLKPKSLVILEIDSHHRMADFHLPGGFQGLIKKDLFGRNRYLLIRRKL